MKNNVISTWTYVCSRNLGELRPMIFCQRKMQTGCIKRSRRAAIAGPIQLSLKFAAESSSVQYYCYLHIVSHVLSSITE